MQNDWSPWRAGNDGASARIWFVFRESNVGRGSRTANNARGVTRRFKTWEATMRKTKAHYVTVRVEFDEPCTRAAAVQAFRETVWGDYYPLFPRMMTIRGVKSAKRHKARARFPDARPKRFPWEPSKED